jgi:hypothetical protein
MYWLTFVVLSLLLYLPPLNLGQHLWSWAEGQRWWMLVLDQPAPPWLGYISWLVFGYLGLGTALHLVHRRLGEGSRLGRFALRLSRAGLGDVEAIAVGLAAAVLGLAWPVLPLAHEMYGWRYAISVPVAGLALLYPVAEALRLAEGHYWADQAYEAGRVRWLAEQGHG